MRPLSKGPGIICVLTVVSRKRQHLQIQRTTTTQGRENSYRQLEERRREERELEKVSLEELRYARKDTETEQQKRGK